jgi:putative membrane protein
VSTIPVPPDLDSTPSVSNHFAWMRTYMSLESTLLSAVRTATTLIGFGFTVAQFFQKLQENAPDSLQAMNPALPRNVGLVLIAAGTISLAMYIHHYHRTDAYLRSSPFGAIAIPKAAALRKPARLISYIVLAVGVLAFGSVLMRF